MVFIGHQKKNHHQFICVMCNMNTFRMYYRTHLEHLNYLMSIILLSYPTKTSETPLLLHYSSHTPPKQVKPPSYSITPHILHQNKWNPLLHHLSARTKFACQICEVRIKMTALSTKYKTQCHLHYMWTLLLYYESTNQVKKPLREPVCGKFQRCKLSKPSKN